MDSKISVRSVSLEPVLCEISCEIYAHQVLTIIGPSGAGKSTLLRLLNRLEEPTSGEIYFNGTSIFALEPSALRQKVGMVFQHPVIFAGTVEDNIVYGPLLRQKELPDRKALASKYLKLVGLDEDFLTRDAGTLSGGEQQRVTIARALANEPEVLLLDEPTSALDPSATLAIEDLIKKMSRDLGLAVVCVTHSMDQARRLGDRTLLLVKGRKIEENDTAAFFESPQQEITSLFIAGRLNQGGEAIV